ncbi:MAG: glutaredoxin family protein [Woeseiaceae bacterium]
MHVIDVYSRQGCHLCEVLIEELMPLVRGTARIVVHDVDSRPKWREQYGDRVPVVEVSGHHVCHFRLDREALIAQLGQLPAEGQE